jgi:hypothetical protein
MDCEKSLFALAQIAEKSTGWVANSLAGLGVAANKSQERVEVEATAPKSNPQKPSNMCADPHFAPHQHQEHFR